MDLERIHCPADERETSRVTLAGTVVVIRERPQGTAAPDGFGAQVKAACRGIAILLSNWG